MANYKLVYLNYRGRAELIRFIFAQAAVPYEDVRISPEKLAEYKPSMSASLHFCKSAAIYPVLLMRITISMLLYFK